MKKHLPALISAVFCCALCILAFAVATPPAQAPRSPEQQVPTPAPTAAPTAAPTPSPEPVTAATTTTTVTAPRETASGTLDFTVLSEPTPVPEATYSARIASVGDLMCHLKNLTAGYNEKRNEFDFTRFFRLVKPYLCDADFTVGNLETTLAEGDEFDDFSGYPLFKTPDEFAEALKDAGFDLLTTANNHMLDNAFTGLCRTLDVLDSLELYHTGSARTKEEAQTPLIVEINKIKFGFLAYTYEIDIRRTPSNMEKYALNLYNTNKAKEDIARAKAAGAEVVLVSLHWGPTENIFKPTENYQKAVKNLLTAGADGILGHHPHVLQPMEWITVTREDGQEVTCPVLYSQGNFHCNPAKDQNAESCISYLTFEKNNFTGKITCTEMAALPVYIYRIKTTPRDYLLVPIGRALDDKEYYEDIGINMKSTLKEGWENITKVLGDQVEILR